VLRFITGKTGGGKSKLAVAMLIDELRYTDRMIFTNLAVELHPWIFNGKPMLGLLHILEREFGETYDAPRRIVFLEQNEIAEFYRHRARRTEDSVERFIVDDHEDGLFHADRTVPGAAYFIDEAHENFPQSEWAKIGKKTMSWASQNRRAGDDGWMMTQEAELVAKPFRRQSLECYWMINHAYFALGPFKRPDVITYQLHITTPPSAGSPPLRSSKIHYRADLLHHCYNTAKGAGVAGKAADVGSKVRGLPFWALPIGILSLAAVFLLGIKGCQKGVRAFVEQGSGIRPSGLAAPVGSNAVAPIGSHSTVVEQLRSSVTMSAPARVAELGVKKTGKSDIPQSPYWVVGYATGINGKLFMLSDGTSFYAKQWTEGALTWYIDGIEFPKSDGRMLPKPVQHPVNRPYAN